MRWLTKVGQISQVVTASTALKAAQKTPKLVAVFSFQQEIIVWVYPEIRQKPPVRGQILFSQLGQKFTVPKWES